MHKTPPPPLTPEEYTQLGRRSLTNAMRIELATRKIQLMGQKSYVRKHIAKAANLSEHTVQRYMHIKAKGDAELREKVLCGQLKIGTAHRQVAGAGKPERVVVTIMTREPLCPGYVCKEPDYAKVVMDNLRLVGNYCAFLLRNSKYCVGVADGLCAWATGCAKRVVKMGAKVGA